MQTRRKQKRRREQDQILALIGLDEAYVKERLYSGINIYDIVRIIPLLAMMSCVPKLNALVILLDSVSKYARMLRL